MAERRELSAAKATKDEPISHPTTSHFPRRSKRIRNKKQTTTQPPPLQSHDDTPEETGLTSIFPGEVLLEIFLRLPDRRSVFRYLTVCKRWFSLIKANRAYLESSYPTVLFSFSPRSDDQILHQLFPEQSQILDRVGTPSVEPCSLDFLPDWPAVAVRASCGDLLLVSRSLVHYFICNPITRRWIALPEAPRPPREVTPESDRGYGLVSEPDGQSYKVVIADWNSVLHGFYKIMLSIFSSKSGQWTSIYPQFEFPTRIRTYRENRGLPFLDLVANGGGVLHWIGPNGRTETKLSGVIAFNPFDGELRFINLPCPSWCFGRVCGPFLDRLRLGAVGGRVRISRVVKVNGVRFGLKIWELAEDCSSDNGGGGSGSWNLVHNVSLKKVKSTLFLLALHPTDRDVVFVACDGEILRFDIGLNEYEKVGELPGKDEPPDVLKEKAASHMKVFPLVHSLWPTPVPQLPSL